MAEMRVPCVTNTDPPNKVCDIPTPPNCSVEIPGANTEPYQSIEMEKIHQRTAGTTDNHKTNNPSERLGAFSVGATQILSDVDGTLLLPKN
jgi:hypothetical protein